MPTLTLTVDGTIFEFPADWTVQVFDSWTQFTRAAGALGLKGCDVVACDGANLWIIEMKDYTYHGAQPPADLTTTVAQKAAGTMALLFALARAASDSEAKSFAVQSAHTSIIRLALHIDVKVGGKSERDIKATLAPLRQKLMQKAKALGIHKAYVTSSLMPDPATPWVARRDPTTRQSHRDR